jgi:putative nucleotidyltransferase with HDIG domain
MIKQPIAALQAGMKLARDVILDDGRILLLKGFIIKPRYIQRLKAYKVESVYVEEETVPIEKADEELIYEDAFTNIKSIMEGIRRGGPLEVEAVKKTVNDLIHHIMNEDTVFTALAGIRDIDNYTFLHCVDVCIYAIITSKALGMPYDEIRELALAAILHDIGKCKVPLEILNKPDRLTDDEYFVIKNHAIYGMEIIKNTPGLSPRISKIVCQHHEKWDGTGYPVGLKSFDIDRGARIISIADVYDALTANRVYRKRYMPHEAAEYLMSQSELHFDPKILKTFIDNIAIYPEDVVVMLNTGEIARVLPTPRGIMSMRPIVSVITKKDGPPVLSPYTIDLQKNPTVFVVDIIS